MPKNKNILKDDIETTKKIANENLVDKSVKKNLVKKRMLKLNFHTFTVSTSEESEYINNCLSTPKSNILKDQILDYFYSDLFDYPLVENDNKKVIRVKAIIRNNKNKLAVALNIPRTLKNIEQLITYIDGVTNEDERKKLPRYLKLIKLNNAYEFVLNYGMNLIHYFYWDDFSKGAGKDGGESGLLLEECIDKATPYIIELKNKLENDIHKEFIFDDHDLKEISLGNKY
jgi:hypothetical protein